MFCSQCGKYNPETEKKCVYCGSEQLSEKEPASVVVKKDKYDIGALFALFLNIFGLIFVFVLYPAGSEERKTCFNGWLKTFISVVVFVGVMLLLGSCLNSSCSPYNPKV